MMKTKKLTLIAMLIALSVVFHQIEYAIPLPTEIVVPGVKLGLANIIGLIALFMFDGKTMLGVNLSRVILASLLNGSLLGQRFWISLSGVLLSTLVAILLYNKTSLSKIGVSIAASATHCVGQVLVVMITYSQALMISFVPILLIVSIPTGILTGSIATLALKRLGGKK